MRSKKDFSKQAGEDIILAPLFDEPKGRAGIRGTRTLAGARLISIDRIQRDPNQPRKTFPEKTTSELATSIKAQGVLQPITVQYIEGDDYFQIISGERRYQAALKAGLKELPCLVKEAKDDERLLQQLTENLQREDLSPLEEAKGLRILIEKFSYTQEDLAKLLGKSKSSVSESLSLLRLPEDIAREVRTSEQVSKSIILQIVRERNNDKKLELWNKIKTQSLTVRETRDEVKKHRQERGPKPFQLNFWSRDKSCKVSVKFKKSKIKVEEIIKILEEMIANLKKSQ